MPISALPSPYGIGTLGQEAYDFVDFLAASNHFWWQLLPVGPTSYSDSPYQSFSAYAGNPYFVDLVTLKNDGLLTQDELSSVDWGDDPTRVDYKKIYDSRFVLLQKATERGWAQDKKAAEAFAKENAGWLEDYTLFMALKRRFGMVAWTEWPDEDIRLHRPAAVERWRKELAEDIRLFTYIQYLFYQQWDRLRTYAHSKGVGIIGDMPIYVAMDSADVWAEPGSFQLDERNVPTEVSGCPPDSFNADGQLWGNPLYNWDAMKRDGYSWWIRRIAGAARLYDVLRIDHFRGLESYWAVPYGAKTAKDGRWVKGPGMDLMSVLISWFPNIRFIAEDLGFLTPEVHQLLKDSGLPGMKVLEFAFDSREPSNYLPHTYDSSCVCYAGTHDNPPILLWKEEADAADIDMAVRYLGLNEQEGFHWGILRGGMSSVADLFVAQMQDYLGLGAGARMNVPGILGGNWQWRMKKGQIDEALSVKLANMARIYGRSERAWQA